MNDIFEIWDQTKSYVSSATIVNKLNALNGPAERAVKLTSDFINSARNEDHFQNLLQVVESTSVREEWGYLRLFHFLFEYYC